MVTAASRKAPLIDFKARVAGDAKGLRLDDIALAFEHVGQPQLISGSATANWTEALSVEMVLSSRWLDLDRVAKPREGAGSPFDTARNFILAMMEALPKNADSKVNFDLDQASLGGEAVSGITLEVARAQGALLLNNLRAASAGRRQTGARRRRRRRRQRRRLSAAKLRCMAPASPASSIGRRRTRRSPRAVRSEGPFSLQGRLGMSDNGIDLTEAGAEIGGMPITGEVRYGMKDRPRLSVALDGSEIDATQLWPAGIGAFKGCWSDGGSDASAPAKPQLAWLDPATTDLQLRVRAGELTTEQRQAARRRSRRRHRAGTPRHALVQVLTADGLAFELEGNVADVTKSRAARCSGSFGAPNKDAYAKLVQLFDLPADMRQQDASFAALAPMRLAGTVASASASPRLVDIAVDGSVQATRPARRLRAARRRPQQLARGAGRYHRDDRQPRRGRSRRRASARGRRACATQQPRRSPAKSSSRRSARPRRA